MQEFSSVNEARDDAAFRDKEFEHVGVARQEIHWAGGVLGVTEGVYLAFVIKGFHRGAKLTAQGNGVPGDGTHSGALPRLMRL